jgi:hypothetical protein
MPLDLTADAARRVLVLCHLIPLADMTQGEVDFVFRKAAEDAPPLGGSDD